MKNKWIIALLALALLVLPVHGTQASGSGGESVRWSLSGTALTISGKGEMADYTLENRAPWSGMEITTVTVERGVTKVGDLAFYECARLESVRLADTVTTVGDWAFGGCQNLASVTLGNGVTAIGEGAFSWCTGLNSIRLPQGLQKLGAKAFYRCYGIQMITIPASVTDWGSESFAYCENLVSATVSAQVTRLPAWTFYGCTRLSSVVLPQTLTSVGEYAFQNCTHLNTADYSGLEENRSQIEEEIRTDNPDFSGLYGASPAGTSTVQEQGSQTVIQNTTAKETENLSVGTVVTQTVDKTGTGTVQTQINASVETPEGWQELMQEIEDALVKQEQMPDRKSQTVTVDVQLKGEPELPGSVVDKLAGKDVVVTIHTEQGDSFTLEGTATRQTAHQEQYNLSYTLTPQQTETGKEPDGQTADQQIFDLKFHDSMDMNLRATIRLPQGTAGQQATLYLQNGGKEPQILQKVIVDANGFATFYLGNISQKANYRIVVETPDTAVDGDPVYVPDSATQEGFIPYQKISYVVHDEPRMMLGMNSAQFAMAVGCFLLALIVVVGVVMLLLNKRNLEKQRRALQGHGDPETGTKS